jgi:hypothetical protein
MYIHTHTHTHSSQYKDFGRARNIKFGAAVNAACQRNLSACHSGHVCHRFVSLQRILKKVRYKNVLQPTGFDGLLVREGMDGWMDGWVKCELSEIRTWYNKTV